jgi:hypothetical protein
MGALEVNGPIGPDLTRQIQATFRSAIFPEDPQLTENIAHKWLM